LTPTSGAHTWEAGGHADSDELNGMTIVADTSEGSVQQYPDRPRELAKGGCEELDFDGKDLT